MSDSIPNSSELFSLQGKTMLITDIATMNYSDCRSELARDPFYRGQGRSYRDWPTHAPRRQHERQHPQTL